jgi:hypothetical protein
MKRVKSYNQFRESRPIKEEFINKLSRWITGADAKEIGELTDKIKSEYDSYSDEGKKEFKDHLDTYIKSNSGGAGAFFNTSELYKKVLDGGEWYGDISKFIKPYVGGSIDKIKSDLNGILNHLKDKGKEINTKLEKDSIMKKVTDINTKIDKYNKILNEYNRELVNFNKDKLLQEFEYILKSLPGCPWPEEHSSGFFSGEDLSSTTCFINNFNQLDKDKEFIKTDKFNQLVDKFNKRNEVIKETNINKIYEEIDTDLKKFLEDDKLKDYRDKLEKKPNEIRNYDFYQKVIDWAKEELAGKTIKEILRTIIKAKIVVIKNSDLKETKTEGDKLVAGNIVYSGQNFNNLNKENISRFINKEGYILTCAHVVDSSIKTFFTVPAHSKEQRTAVLISICYDKDIALLKADAASQRILEISKDKTIAFNLASQAEADLAIANDKLSKAIESFNVSEKNLTFAQNISTGLFDNISSENTKTLLARFTSKST